MKEDYEEWKAISKILLTSTNAMGAVDGAETCPAETATLAEQQMAWLHKYSVAKSILLSGLSKGDCRRCLRLATFREIWLDVREKVENLAKGIAQKLMEE